MTIIAVTNPDQRLGAHLLAVVRAQDALILAPRRVPRTAVQMRARLVRMADDACPLCGRWSCTGSDCPPSAAVPAVTPLAAPATASGGGQCSYCGQWFPDWNGGVCGVCSSTGRS
ncbi:hypothetical protein OHB41_51375 [Streptomyces sp. NBC_01571]|uniref:hypothetical protein n=1 Tax=Streptomyces sp. NBC_01571 TaxID=2975883 RepID=UPI00224D13C8|nr:hypothetical protein [Streptomyces sp. NBC_01571]MCX4581361.1 hypothetical protein [Streptomyces sp. NBC_01571]